MSTLKELEQEALSLSPQEREHFVLTMWESLEGAAAIDQEGIELASARDAEIESGSVQPISHSEFRRRTSNSE